MTLRSDRVPSILSLLVFGYLAWPYLAGQRGGGLEPEKPAVMAIVSQDVAFESEPLFRDPFLGEDMATNTSVSVTGETAAASVVMQRAPEEQQWVLRGTLISDDVRCAVIGKALHEVGDILTHQDGRSRFRVAEIEQGQVVLESTEDDRRLLLSAGHSNVLLGCASMGDGK